MDIRGTKEESKLITVNYRLKTYKLKTEEKQEPVQNNHLVRQSEKKNRKITKHKTKNLRDDSEKVWRKMKRITRR